MTTALLLLAIWSRLPCLLWAAAPPGPGPFGSTVRPQPVPGAARAQTPDGWTAGKLCEIDAALNNTNATAALQSAIDECGDRAEGGTVLVRNSLTLHTASLWLRSNLTFRVEAGSALVGTATGVGDKVTDPTNLNVTDAPIVYTRRESVMMWAHAGLLNGGRCVKLKDPLVGWDDCAAWSKLENVVIEGGGTLDANAQGWFDDEQPGFVKQARPMMLDLLWIDGLTIRDLSIRRPGFWTVHPTFCDNVVVANNSILTTGPNTDGCDPDSAWNVLIADNVFSTGDDCIAIKAGRDWSGRMVNISTRNVLVERNVFKEGHGISIGSETSGWVLDVEVRDATCDGTDKAVRIKSARGRGGGVRNATYRNIAGTAKEAISLSLHYDYTDVPTNDSATPEIHDVLVQNLTVGATGSAVAVLERSSSDPGAVVSQQQMTMAARLRNPADEELESSSENPLYLECLGLNDSLIDGVTFDQVRVTTAATEDDDVFLANCSFCAGIADASTDPAPCFL